MFLFIMMDDVNHSAVEDSIIAQFWLRVNVPVIMGIRIQRKGRSSIRAENAPKSIAKRIELAKNISRVSSALADISSLNG